jgi:hypothetical protein
MQCPKCSAANPPEANFCGSCGAAMGSLAREPGPISLSEPGPAELPHDTLDLQDARDIAHPEDAEKIAAPLERSVGWSQRESNPASPNRLDLNSPGAGLAPGPADRAADVGPLIVAPPSAELPPPPAQYAQASYAPPQQYGYQGPREGNFSGMGPGYPYPPEARGWTFGGFVPYGIYAFVHGNVLLGIVSIFFWPIGQIIVCAMGRQMAWENRRFETVQQFYETMRTWNLIGLIFGILQVSGIELYFVLIFFAMCMAMKEVV